MKMESQASNQISMAIDVKKNRLRVHKGTLRALGNPPYVQLLFSPKRKEIVVLKRDRRIPNGQEIKVVFDRSDPPGCFDIYSKELMERIRKQFSGLDQKGLYRLTGFAMPEEGGVCFPLSTLSRQEAPHV
jgi:hypothetical protein